MASQLVDSLRTIEVPPFAVRGSVRLVLRLEGLALFALALVVYVALLHGDGGLFAAFFLAPDLAFLGYLAGPRVGALSYNATHSTIGPALLVSLALLAAPEVLPFGAIWLAHVGFDRMLGYGLKYPSAFGHTHLGAVGREAR